MSADLLELKPFAESLDGFPLDQTYKNLMIIVRDGTGENKENGQFTQFTSIIEVEVDSSKGFSPATFRNIVFHEFGHLIFQRFIEQNTSTIQNIADIQIRFSKIDKTSGDLPYGYFQDNEKLQNLQTIVAPFHELFADIFKLMVLKGEGKRDAGYSWSTVAWTRSMITSDPHHLLDPVRNYLWQQWLGKNLSNPNELIRGGKLLLALMAKAIDESTVGCSDDSNCTLDTYKTNLALINKISTILK